MPRMLISCICPTADRPEFTADAIGYFRLQSHPAAQRRLLVFDTSLNPPMAAPTESDGPGPISHATRMTYLDAERRICHWWEPRLPGDTIGAIRNRANARALRLWPDTDLLAHMDSDDYYGPTRLAHQAELLAASGKRVAGFGPAKFTDGTRWWMYAGSPAFALGASLVYFPDYWRRHMFPDLQISEDTFWTGEACRAGQLLRSDATSNFVPDYTPEDLLVVRCHAGNTSPKVPQQNWQKLN